MRFLMVSLALGILLSTGCERSKKEKIQLDGSSTVYLISEAVAEEYGKAHKNVRVTVGISGTGGGFKRFCAGETDINDASRAIKAEEAELAKTQKIDFIELPVAYDGIAVVANPKAKFLDNLTVAELKRIWEPSSKVKTWNDVRATWPKEEIKLFGPGPDSGTFDYFTKVINGKEKACRSSYSASEDDNVLVQGVSGDAYALGFFGFAYYEKNKDKLKIVPVKVDAQAEAVIPNSQTIDSGAYKPLSRPIFIYVSTKALKRPAVVKFLEFYLDQAPTLAPEVGYVALPEAVRKMVKERFQKRVTGSVFNKAKKGQTVVSILKGS